TTVKLPAIKTAASVEIANLNHETGQFDVIVSNITITNGLKKVQVPVWSSVGGQDDVKWYEASLQSNGTYLVTVQAKNHKNSSGTYHAHVYLTDTLNNRSFVAATTTNLDYVSSGSAATGNYAVLNKVIYLDAGHGGADPGAVYFGHSEKTLNMKIQELVKSKLEKAGYSVLYTRTDDTFVGLLDRSIKVNATNADLFISIHFNASPNASTNGIETYYYQYYSEYPSRINAELHNNEERVARSASLANAIQSNLVQQTGAANRGVLRNTFAVLRETATPAVLLELGYMSNAAESAKITSAAYQEKLATGIVNGILAYYKQYGN
ncbi:TPA: N-acetylmuramoyl-L-alanine amidase, partial [Streptococcus suis]|nr:N-acetylmuramoyl-L-alanine amidase [Streptococcus suis]